MRIKPSICTYVSILYTGFFYLDFALALVGAHFAARSITGPFHQILRCSESNWLKKGHQDLVELKCWKNGKKFGTLHEFACHPCAKYFPLLEVVISKS